MRSIEGLDVLMTRFRSLASVLYTQICWLYCNPSFGFTRIVCKHICTPTSAHLRVDHLRGRTFWNQRYEIGKGIADVYQKYMDDLPCRRQT
jgi:hypothetical protein